MTTIERWLRNLINMANMHRFADNCDERCTVSLMDVKAVADLLVEVAMHDERDKLQRLIDETNWS